MEEKLDDKYKIILRVVLNKSWRQQSTKQQVYGHLPPITRTIKIRRTRHAGRCWRSKDEFISYIILWSPLHERTEAGRPSRTDIQQFSSALKTCREQWTIDTGSEWKSGSTVLVAWHVYIYIYIYIYLYIYIYIYILKSDSCIQSIISIKKKKVG